MKLDSRMKCYESSSDSRLVRKVPVVVRVDGRAFHTFARRAKLARPFDERFSECMLAASESLCREIAGAVVAYTFSDEISVLVLDTAREDTEPWFDYRVQKVASVSASICTVSFYEACVRLGVAVDVSSPTFDARAFNVPESDVNNYFVWRQFDAVRNSIQSLGQSRFPNAQLLEKSNGEIQEMLFVREGVNWNDVPAIQKRGACVVRSTDGKWTKDRDIPSFTSSSYVSLAIDRAVSRCVDINCTKSDQLSEAASQTKSTKPTQPQNRLLRDRDVKSRTSG